MSKYSDALEKMQEERRKKTVQNQTLPASEPQPAELKKTSPEEAQTAVNSEPPILAEDPCEKTVLSIDLKDKNPNFVAKPPLPYRNPMPGVSSILERWRNGEALVRTIQQDHFVELPVPRDKETSYQELRTAFQSLQAAHPQNPSQNSRPTNP